MGNKILYDVYNNYVHKDEKKKHRTRLQSWLIYKH